MPSRSGLLLRLLVSAVVGAAIVVGVVLPAEYNIDPTGFGKLTGLVALAAPPAPPQQPNTAPTAQEAAQIIPKEMADKTWLYKEEFRTDTVKIPLPAEGELEYKVQVKKGGVIVYNWTVDQGTVYYDFHGEPPDNPKGSQRYAEEQENNKANGALVAPFDGIHGWFWLNLTDKPQVITLKLSGFYELKPGILK
jgi:hypothetical protein